MSLDDEITTPSCSYALAMIETKLDILRELLEGDDLETASRLCLVRKISVIRKDITLINIQIKVILAFIIAILCMIAWSVYD